MKSQQFNFVLHQPDQIGWQNQNKKGVRAHHLHTFSCLLLLHCCTLFIALTVRVKQGGVKLKDMDMETIGNIVMTPWKIIHKHPDILSTCLLPLASLRDGLNSFVFSGDSCLAATSCFGCLQYVFVVTWNTCESSGPCVTHVAQWQSSTCKLKVHI